MAIILEAAYSKKLGLPNFSSHSYVVSIRTELTDINQVPEESTKLYKMLQEAVDKEIQEVGFMPDATQYGMNGGNDHQANSNEHTNGNGHRQNGEGTRKVVIMPRHFLTDNSLSPVKGMGSHLRKFAERYEPGVHEVLFDIGNSKVSGFVLNIPELLEAIRAVFRSNFYGDRHRDLLLSQQALRIHNLATREGKDVVIAGYLEQVYSLSGPYYYFSPGDFSDPPPEVKVRLDHRDRILNARVAHGSELFENPDGPVRPGQYSEDAAFLALLTDFDADFLLSAIDEKVRAAIDKAATDWAEMVEKIVIKNYWVEKTGRPNMQRITKALPESWRNSVNKYEDVIVGAVDKALVTFLDNRKRVVRAAIETAQRLALAHFEPATIVIEDEESILRSWHAFVREPVRGALVEEHELGKVEITVPDLNQLKRPRKKSTVNKNPHDTAGTFSENDEGEIENSVGFDAGDPDEIEEICDIVERLLQDGSRNGLLTRFAELSREISRWTSWNDALTQIEEAHPGVRSRVTEALGICETDLFNDGQPSKETLKKLHLLFPKP